MDQNANAEAGLREVELRRSAGESVEAPEHRERFQRNRVIELLVERIEFDGKAQSVSITFRPSGIRVLEEAVA